MNPEERFLQAIFADPDDDAPRLMYADWLSERGDPRGEFIHLQCELNRIERTDVNRPDLEERAKELQAAHGHAWAGPVADLVTRYEFHRGFIEAVTIRTQAFLERGGRLFRAAPVRRVTLQALDALMPQLAACEHLKHLHALDLRQTGMLDEACEQLAGSPHVGGLRRLILRQNSVNNRGVVAIIESPQLAGLTGLDLSANRTYFLYRGAQWLGSPGLARLRELHLGLTGLGDQGAQTLATCSHLANLTRLALWNTQIRDRGLEALVTSAYLTNLTELDLSGNHFKTAGVRALAGSPNMAKLETLCLGNNEIYDEGCVALAQSRYLKRLTYLTVGSSSIGEVGRAVLRERFAERVRFEI